MSNKAVFLDRDGVLVQARLIDGVPHPPRNADSMEIVPEARRELERLQAAGFLCVVVTNQPDIARGKLGAGELEAMHRKLRNELPLHGLYVCSHDDEDACECRKPKPGLLLRAANELTIEVKKSYLIGDRWRDIDAGACAGCQTVLLDHGYDERKPDHKPQATVDSLRAAIEWILAR